MSSTPLFTGSGATSTADQEVDEVRKDLQERMSLNGSKKQKEFDDIVESLDNFEVRPGAPWGFVIVRAAYGPSIDAPWAKMLKLLRSHIAETLELEEQAYLLPRHELTIIEDEATLAGADSYAVRRAFRAWVAGDLPERFTDQTTDKFGGTPRIREKLRGNEPHFGTGGPEGLHPATSGTPRWQYCLFVDAACLRSVDMPSDLKNEEEEEEEEEEEFQDPVFKILTTDCTPTRENTPTEDFTFDWEGGETNNDAEMIGWMYMEMSDYAYTYNRLVTDGFWLDFYQRPQKYEPDHRS